MNTGAHLCHIHAYPIFPLTHYSSPSLFSVMWSLMSLPVNRLIPTDCNADGGSCQLPRPDYSPPYNSILLMSYYSSHIHQVNAKSHNRTGYDALMYFLLTHIMPFLSISAIARLTNKRKLLTAQTGFPQSITSTSTLVD